jgi:hypothetical protein
MNTKYFTFIVRLRLDAEAYQDPADRTISGSLQQAGSQEFRYFDSSDKLQEMIQQLVDEVILSIQSGSKGT